MRPQFRWLALLLAAGRALLGSALLLLAACAESPATSEDSASPDDALTAEIAEDTASTLDTATTDVWPDGFWLPHDISQLYGLWVNDDGETIRALELAQFDPYDPDMLNISPVYGLYRYPKGGKAVLIERGRATLAMGPLLHLETIWSDTVTDKGKKTDLTLMPAPAGTFALATGSGTPRVYGKANALP